MRIAFLHRLPVGGTRADALQVGENVGITGDVTRHEDAHRRQDEHHDDVGGGEFLAGELELHGEYRALQLRSQRSREILVRGLSSALGGIAPANCTGIIEELAK